MSEMVERLQKSIVQGHSVTFRVGDMVMTYAVDHLPADCMRYLSEDQKAMIDEALK